MLKWCRRKVGHTVSLIKFPSLFQKLFTEAEALPWGRLHLHSSSSSSSYWWLSDSLIHPFGWAFFVFLFSHDAIGARTMNDAMNPCWATANSYYVAAGFLVKFQLSFPESYSGNQHAESLWLFSGFCFCFFPFLQSLACTNTECHTHTAGPESYEHHRQLRSQKN